MARGSTKTTPAYRHVDAAVRKLCSTDRLRPGLQFILLEFLPRYSLADACTTWRDPAEAFYRLTTIPAGFRHVRMLILRVVTRRKEDGNGERCLDVSGRAYDFDDGSSERYSPLDPFNVLEHWVVGRVVTQREDIPPSASPSSLLKKTADWRQSVWGYNVDSGLLAMGTTEEEASALEAYGRGMKEYTLHNNNCVKYAYTVAKGAASVGGGPSLAARPHWGAKWAVLIRRDPAVVFASDVLIVGEAADQVEASQMKSDIRDMDRGFGVAEAPPYSHKRLIGKRKASEGEIDGEY